MIKGFMWRRSFPPQQKLARYSLSFTLSNTAQLTAQLAVVPLPPTTWTGCSSPHHQQIRKPLPLTSNSRCSSLSPPATAAGLVLLAPPSPCSTPPQQPPIPSPFSSFPIISHLFFFVISLMFDVDFVFFSLNLIMGKSLIDDWKITMN